MLAYRLLATIASSRQHTELEGSGPRWPMGKGETRL
jgi:hypothetical protein